MMLDSLDVHVGQSYSVLVTADQDAADYYIVAAPKLYNNSDLSRHGIGILHYDNSITAAMGPLPSGPDPFDLEFSINQARLIRSHYFKPLPPKSILVSLTESHLLLERIFVV